MQASQCRLDMLALSACQNGIVSAPDSIHEAINNEAKPADLRTDDHMATIQVFDRGIAGHSIGSSKPCA